MSLIYGRIFSEQRFPFFGIAFNNWKLSNRSDFISRSKSGIYHDGTGFEIFARREIRCATMQVKCRAGSPKGKHKKTEVITGKEKTGLLWAIKLNEKLSSLQKLRLIARRRPHILTSLLQKK